MKNKALEYDLITVSMLWRLLLEREGSKVDMSSYEGIECVRELLDEIKDEILWELVGAFREENRHKKTNVFINMPSQQDS